jgi:hypothetical protein
MKSNAKFINIIACAVILISSSSYAQTWQLSTDGNSIKPASSTNYHIRVFGYPTWAFGNPAILWFGDEGNQHYIKAVYGQGIKIGTAGAPDGLTLSEGTGNVTITKGDLILSQGKINIKNSWTIEAPDYVFAKGYKLPSLQEVEKKINEEQHLPGIPSAAEIKEKGVELTEMNMKLLRKMEEMTLYVIDQNKKIEELEKKVAMLASKKSHSATEKVSE